MKEKRRKFLMALAAVASCCTAMDGFVFSQTRKHSPFPDPPQPAETQNPAEMNASKQDSQSAKRAQLEQNEKEFRAEVERLYQLTSELKQEVDSTATTQVFSVQMYKRAEKIEKLAKQLKSKAKG
jgi:flagellar motility protein MotE (MotC chaperone)